VKTIAAAGAILERDDYAFMVKIRRRGMNRWELPTAIVHPEEFADDAAFRCVFEESDRQTFVRVDQPVCLCLHRSIQLDITFFGMFFKCVLDEANKESHALPPIELSTKYVPPSAEQQIIKSGFVPWWNIPEREIHPLHRRLLLKWHETKGENLFLISGDADAEIPFYYGWENIEKLDISIIFP
jgi:hypothetical protein